VHSWLEISAIPEPYGDMSRADSERVGLKLMVQVCHPFVTLPKNPLGIANKKYSQLSYPLGIVSPEITGAIA
jgi:hypothetical protein